MNSFDEKVKSWSFDARMPELKKTDEMPDCIKKYAETNRMKRGHYPFKTTSVGTGFEIPFDIYRAKSVRTQMYKYNKMLDAKFVVGYNDEKNVYVVWRLS